NATEAAQVLGTQVTFWGDPASEAHDQSRGWACLREGLERNENETCEPPNPRSSTAFLTLPTSCAGALSTAMDGVAWTGEQTAATFTFADALGAPLNALEGCQDLPFAPSIAAEALQPADEGHAAERTTAANTPTGLEVDVDAPQTATLDPSALAESDVQSATVTLPRGVLLNPSAANGLEACSEQQVGYLGVGAGDPFSPGTAEPLRFSAAPAECPRGSKLGTVRVKTPLLAEELEGSVYLAAQEANPFGSLVALYLVAENRALGLRVKLAGESKLDGVTGQITTTFQNTPQVPFESFRVQLFGGPRGAVTTPSACGEYTTTASFTPWSGGEAVASSADPSAFAITSGPGGGPCSQTPPLAPAFEAGSTNSAAGAFTPFQLHIGRADSDQALTGVTVHLPAGMAALLASITPCPEPQAALGTCGPDSLIGHATATVGLGPDPFTVGGGRVYLTGPYGGGPFGLSIVTPAIAGPFNLGDVVVRSSIKIDPTTAAVTIATTLPTIVQGVGKPSSGVPLQLKAVDVTVDRSGFEFNPTNCTATSIGATITGDQGASSDVSSRFQVTGCGTLPFAPKLTATVDGHASKKFGVGFAVKVTSAGLGQANIRKVLLSLPRALPSRLETLQKACDEAIFNANPATCNEASVIGKAVVHTPVLKSPLTGPAYLVSHGGAEFPDVEFLLQGEGITLLLDGKTFIDEKAGITHSRFEAVPDAPFTSFETSLPAGPHSIFGAYVPKTPYNLCGSKLQMPTEIVGQNNAVINKTTIVGVTGCGARGGHITAAQRLAKAVKRCHARFPHSKLKRTSCEKTARRMYGSKKHARRAPSRHASKH
ncbi:MAG TPA: hypothetical protein VH025_09725, partial [Solirubrobacteraceae bacterium]|nr:hypothetical protein [Solirubrobacteraceae bacterium]